jgi:hypothetical protein
VMILRVRGLARDARGRKNCANVPQFFCSAI